MNVGLLQSTTLQHTLPTSTAENLHSTHVAGPTLWLHGASDRLIFPSLRERKKLARRKRTRLETYEQMLLRHPNKTPQKIDTFKFLCTQKQ